jgi:hypothetical protein
MNQNLRFTASFTTILLLGILAFIYQTRYLGGLQIQSNSQAAAVGNCAPTLDQSTKPEGSAAAMEKQSPATATVATVDPVAVFMDTINEKLVTLVKPEHLAKIIGDRTQLERVAAVVKLSDEERENVQKRLEQFEIAKCSLLLNPNLTPAARASELAKARRQKDDWLSAQLGKKRSDEVTRASQLHENAATELRASLAVSRMSATLNLSDEQKKQLQAGLVERDLDPLTQPMLSAKVYGTIQTEPPVPDISEDAEKILTPAQWQFHQTQHAAKSQENEELSEMSEMMSGLLPTLFEEIFKN